ncbi:hypothetical protein NO1_1626 [Candidatus Termititenax aidoneus]|uniref:Uncharacterized protein n=1 Tax=Termititenax aidoneus TaxID=2218524 RepID=A0A388TCS6_TERA1|nr:hypothetical protein NO1_1626 [Candidatus Termititenax aidoneus]
MLKKIFFFLIVLTAFLSALLTIDVQPKKGGNTVHFDTAVGSGFYGDDTGSIILVIDRDGSDLNKKNVYLKMDYWAGPDNLSLQNGSLQWKVYYQSGGLAAYPRDWTAYSVRETPAFELNDTAQHIEIELGTLLKYVPVVQPNGHYETRIEVRVD